MLGVKMYGNEWCRPGNIVMRQRGTEFHPGPGMGMVCLMTCGKPVTAGFSPGCPDIAGQPVERPTLTGVSAKLASAEVWSRSCLPLRLLTCVCWLAGVPLGAACISTSC
jgi:hypothetical protein